MTDDEKTILDALADKLDAAVAVLEAAPVQDNDDVAKVIDDATSGVWAVAAELRDFVKAQGA